MGEKASSGSILAVMLVLIFVAFMFAGGIFTMTQRLVVNTGTTHWQSKCHYAALAAVNEAIARLEANLALEGDFSGVLEGDDSVRYAYTIFNNLAGQKSGASGQAVLGPDGQTYVPVGTALVLSVGYLPDRAEEAAQAVAGLVGYDRFVFDHAAFGHLNVVAQQSVIDSFDSNLLPSLTYPTETIAAWLGTNGVQSGAVQVSNSTVRGHRIAGYGADIGTAIQLSGGNQLRGDNQAREGTRELTRIRLPDPEAPSGRHGRPSPARLGLAAGSHDSLPGQMVGTATVPAELWLGGGVIIYNGNLRLVNAEVKSWGTEQYPTILFVTGCRYLTMTIQIWPFNSGLRSPATQKDDGYYEEECLLHRTARRSPTDV